MKIKTSFTLSWKGLLLSIDATYSPGTPDVMYLRNGDPGYPGDPAEVEFTITDIGLDDWDSVKDALKKDSVIDLDSEDLYLRILEECEEFCSEHEERVYHGWRNVEE